MREGNPWWVLSSIASAFCGSIAAYLIIYSDGTTHERVNGFMWSYGLTNVIFSPILAKLVVRKEGMEYWMSTFLFSQPYKHVYPALSIVCMLVANCFFVLSIQAVN